MTLLFAVGHLHTGGLNISLSLNGRAVCTSLPTYGTELGVAGNEKVPPVYPRSAPAVYLRSGARPPACSALPRLQASSSAATTTATTGHFHRHHCAAAQGYLVHMSHCVDSSTGVLELRKGDELTIDGHYFVGSHDPRLLYSDGTHLNVMR